MFDGKSISLLTRLKRGANVCQRPMILAAWVVCGLLLSSSGCSTSITVDGESPFNKTAAKLRQAVRQKSERSIEPGTIPVETQPSTNAQPNIRSVTQTVDANPLTAAQESNLIQPPEVAQASYQQQPASTTYSSSGQMSTEETAPDNSAYSMQEAIQKPVPTHDSTMQYSSSNSKTSPQSFNSFPNETAYQRAQPETQRSLNMTNGLRSEQNWQRFSATQPEPQAPLNVTNGLRSERNWQRFSVTQPVNPSNAAFSSNGNSVAGHKQPMVSLTDSSPGGRMMATQPIHPAAGTGHMVGGMNFQGSELRQRFVTATEVALRLKDENEFLRSEIQFLRTQLNQLSQQNEKQVKQLSQTREEALQVKRENAELRKSIAKFKVKVQDLEKEKIVIEQNADRALREIESTLDHLLIDSVSKTPKLQPPQLQPPQLQPPKGSPN